MPPPHEPQMIRHNGQLNELHLNCFNQTGTTNCTDPDLYRSKGQGAVELVKRKRAGGVGLYAIEVLNLDVLRTSDVDDVQIQSVFFTEIEPTISVSVV